MPVVHRNYSEPQYEPFRARTLWSLSNAFTTAFKDLRPVRQFEATAKLGAFLSSIGSLQGETRERVSGQNIIEDAEVASGYDDELMEEYLEKTAS